MDNTLRLLREGRLTNQQLRWLNELREHGYLRMPRGMGKTTISQIMAREYINSGQNAVVVPYLPDLPDPRTVYVVDGKHSTFVYRHRPSKL